MLSAIICATDLSHRSDRALERAAQIADQCNLPLHVIHVIDPEIPEALWQAQKDQVRAEIREALRRVMTSPAGAGTQIEILVGRPSAEIAAYAAAMKGSLVVLGYPRVPESGDVSFASFSAGRILRAAVAPVLVAKMQGARPYRRAIVGIDFSSSSAYAAALATELLSEGEVTLLHVRDISSEREESDSGQKLKELVELGQGQTGKDGSRLIRTKRVREGDVHQVLRAEVTESGAELLVLGTHGRSGLSRVLFGSVAEDMLTAMPCDLLVAVPN